MASTSSPVALTFSASRNAEAASAQAIAAAQRAAELNADAQRGSKYASSASGVTAIAIAAAQTQGVVTATVLRAAAGKLPAEAVVDTTGAGDSFIGSVLYGLSTGLSYPRMLQLGGVVAACKCTELGARPGLPHCSGLARHLLHDS